MSSAHGAVAVERNLLVPLSDGVERAADLYEYVPAIRYGDLFDLRATQASVRGLNENMTFYRFYNVWLEK